MDDNIEWRFAFDTTNVLIGKSNTSLWYIQLYYPKGFVISVFNINLTKTPQWLKDKCASSPIFETLDCATNYCEYLQELWSYREKNSYISSN